MDREPVSNHGLTVLSSPAKEQQLRCKKVYGAPIRMYVTASKSMYEGRPLAQARAVGFIA